LPSNAKKISKNIAKNIIWCSIIIAQSVYDFSLFMTVEQRKLNHQPRFTRVNMTNQLTKVVNFSFHNSVYYGLFLFFCQYIKRFFWISKGKSSLPATAKIGIVRLYLIRGQYVNSIDILFLSVKTNFYLINYFLRQSSD